MTSLSFSSRSAVWSFGRTLARPIVRELRAIPSTVSAEWARQGRGPRVAFLPSRGKEQSSLLRVYNVAQSLNARGWQTLVVPWKLTLVQRQALLRRFSPSLVVMQGSRHALNQPDLYPGCKIIYDMDDADFHLPHLAGVVAEAMPQVAGVIAGSSYVADWCRSNGARAADVVWTGTPLSGLRPVAQADRPCVVAWSQTRPESYKAEARWVVHVMQKLSQRCPDVRLRLYDRQPGDGAFLERFRDAGITTHWLPTMKYGDYLRSLGDVALGLAPLCPQQPFSRGKSFGKVLAYLDRHVPVIASDACEHGAFFDPSTGIVSNDPDVWVESMVRLLADPAARQSMADAAFEKFKVQLSIEQAAQRTDRILRQYLA